MPKKVGILRFSDRLRYKKFIIIVEAGPFAGPAHETFYSKSIYCLIKKTLSVF
jgi:hypothetical protein